MKTTLSVIVPVLNRESLVLKSLESIVSQTRLPDELIVVDNGSTDSSYLTVFEWMKKQNDKDIDMKLIKESRPGAVHARQKGFLESKGDFVLFFDSDDIMRPSLVKDALDVAEINSKADLVCWKCCLHFLDGTKRIPPFNPQRAMEAHLVDALLRTQGYMVKRSFLEKTGAWTKPLKVWNDFELGLRLLIHEPVIQSIDKVLVDIYSQKESITGESFTAKQGEWETTLDEMNVEVEKSDRPDKKRIRNILDYRRIILAATYFKEGNYEGAKSLLAKTLAISDRSKRFPLRFSYEYTKRGFRGVWHIVRYFY